MTDSTEKKQKPHLDGQNVKKMTEKKMPRKSVECKAGETELETQHKLAELICGPDLAAFRVMKAVEESFFKDIDVPILIKHLRDQACAVQGGNMSHTEAMLTLQATALQSLFSRLVERGMEQATLSVMESFMKLALRAQNQCRSTLETLATIKNPPVVYARQANFANGPQQVNNGCAKVPRARNNKIKQTQLLETIPNERMDFGTTETAIGNDQVMAPVGKVDRT